MKIKLYREKNHFAYRYFQLCNIEVVAKLQNIKQHKHHIDEEISFYLFKFRLIIDPLKILVNVGTL